MCVFHHFIRNKNLNQYTRGYWSIPDKFHLLKPSQLCWAGFLDLRWCVHPSMCPSVPSAVNKYLQCMKPTFLPSFWPTDGTVQHEEANHPRGKAGWGGIGGTRNTSCAIWCLETKAFFDYKMLHDGWKTIVTKGDLDNINNRVFKLPRLANFDLHKKLT